MTQQANHIPSTWISPKAKLVYHPPVAPSNTEAWGVSLHEECNCPDPEHEEHWIYQGATVYSFQEAIDNLKTFWRTRL